MVPPGPFAQALAAEIRRRITDEGWSGRELSRRTGIGNNAMAMKLRADVAFDADEIAAVAQALNLTPAELVSAAEHP